MDLRSFLAVLWRHKVVVVVTTVLALTISVVGTQFSENRYRASTTLRLMTATRGSIIWLDYDLNYADRLMNTYAQVARSASVRTQLANDLNLTEQPAVRVEIIANTELMKISTEHSDPLVAAKSANRVAELLIQDSAQSAMTAAESAQQAIAAAIAQSEQELLVARTNYEHLRTEFESETAATVIAAARAVDLAEKTSETLIEQYQFSQIRDALQTPMLTVLDQAVVPTQPFQPNSFLNLGIGLALGLIGGMGLAFLFENLTLHTISSPHTKSVKELPSPDSRLLLPPVSEVSRNALLAPQKPVVVECGVEHNNQTFYPLHDAIWKLAANCERGRCILIVSVVSQMKDMEPSLVFTSSLVAKGKKVVLVDSDFHAPKLHQFLNLPNEVGLSTLLLQQSSLDETIWLSKRHGIYLIPAGPKPRHPEQLIASTAMDIVFDILTMQFDIVLVNAPTLSMTEDLALLAQYAQGIVLHVQDRNTWQRYESMVQQQLATGDSPLLGVIVQQTSTNSRYRANATHGSNGTSKLYQPLPPVTYS